MESMQDFVWYILLHHQAPTILIEAPPAPQAGWSKSQFAGGSGKGGRISGSSSKAKLASSGDLSSDTVRAIKSCDELQATCRSLFRFSLPLSTMKLGYRITTFVREQAKLHVQALTDSGRGPTGGIAGQDGASSVRPLRPERDPLLRALDIITSVISDLQAPLKTRGKHGQFYGLTLSAAIEALEMRLGVFSAMQFELIAYARAYEVPPLYALRGRLAVLYCVLRSSPFLRSRFDTKTIFSLWDGALGRTRAGRRAFFDFLSRASGGNRLEPRKLGRDYGSLSKVVKMLFASDNDDANAAKIGYCLSYRMEVVNALTNG